MKKIIIFLMAVAAVLSSCKKTQEPLATSTTLKMEMVRLSQTSAQVSVTYEGDKPHYVRYMKAVKASEMSDVDFDDKAQVAAFINVRSYLTLVPFDITSTGLESLLEYVCGAVAFNRNNDIIGVSYIRFTAQAPEEAIGDEGGAGDVEVVTL